MNGLGDRLDNLARQATRETALVDPSTADGSEASLPPASVTRSRRPVIVVGLAAMVLIAALLAIWPSGDRPATSVVAGEGDDAPAPLASPAQEPMQLEDATEPDPTEPDPSELDPSELDPSELDPSELDPSEPDPTEPDPSEPDPSGPDQAEPQQAQPASPTEQDELQQTTIQAAESRWQESGIQDYRLSYGEFRSEGRSSPVALHVEGGQVVDIEVAEGFDEPDRTWTVDDMFAAMEEADTVREVEFDASGAPRVLSLDPDRTVPGDEFALRSIELVAQRDLDRAGTVLEAWLPPSSDVPAALVAFFEQSRWFGGTEIDQVYVLHQVPDLHAFLYLHDDQICVVVAQIRATDPLEYSGLSSSCRWVTDFLTSPLRQGSINSGDSTAFLLVIPALDVADEAWTVEGEGGELDVTEWSALLTLEGKAAPGRERILFNCPCGDRVFILSN